MRDLPLARDAYAIEYVMITVKRMKANSSLEKGTCPTAEARFFNHVQGHGCRPSGEQQMRWQ